MRRRAIGAVVAAVLLASTPSVAAGAKWAPCQNEDGPGPCVWDGRHMGNGVGRSYIVRKSGAVDYVTHRRAHRMIGD